MKGPSPSRPVTSQPAADPQNHGTGVGADMFSQSQDLSRGPPMPTPSRTSYNPGLDPLDSVSQLELKQQVTDILWNAQNEYLVKLPGGHPIYLIHEYTGALTRWLAGNRQRHFALAMKNLQTGHDVLVMEGSPGFVLGFGGGGCEIAVMMGPICIGGVRQVGTDSNPQYDLYDHTGRSVLTLKSEDVPCTCCCFGAGAGAATAEFHLQQLNGERIGRLGKEWGGVLRETFSSADTFGLLFPEDLAIRMKAVLIAAAVMIDFQFYEKKSRNRRHRH